MYLHDINIILCNENDELDYYPITLNNNKWAYTIALTQE